MLIQVSFHSIFSRQCRKICSSLRINHFSKEAKLVRRTSFDILRNTLEATTVSTNYDWNQIRESILQNEGNRNHYSLENIDASILNYCIDNNTSMGLSYIDYMSIQKIERNLATNGKYLQLLFSKNLGQLLEGKKCSPTEETKILQCYDSLQNKYPVLDSSTLENCILALSITNYWKKSLDLLKEIEITTFPSNKSYSALIAAAFLNDDHRLAWKLLEDMLCNEKIPTSLPFITYINSIKNSPNVKLLLEQLLLFFQSTDYCCNEDVIPYMSKLVKFMRLQATYVNVSTYISTSLKKCFS